MKKNYRIRLIWGKRSYYSWEIAELLGVHIRTVQDWVKSGLPILEGSRPSMVMGADLKKFLIDKQRKRRILLNEGEIYCLVCKKGVEPTDLTKTWTNRKIGHNKQSIEFIGTCPDCGRKIVRFGAELWDKPIFSESVF